MWVRKQKKLKSFIGFLSADKIDNHNRPGWGWQGEGGKKWKKKSKRIYRTSQKIRIINVFFFFWFSTVRVLSRAGNHHPPYLPRMPSNRVLIFGPAVRALQILIWSYSCVFCLQCPQLSQPVRFLLWELSMAFYIFHRHRVCLVDCVDLICSLYSWWEGFGSSSLAIVPLGFNCGFISTSICGLSTGV